MSKKLLSLALALVMCLGLTVPAFAAGTEKVVVDETHGVKITLNGFLREETQRYNREVGYDEETGRLHGWTGDFTIYVVADNSTVTVEALEGRKYADPSFVEVMKDHSRYQNFFIDTNTPEYAAYQTFQENIDQYAYESTYNHDWDPENKSFYDFASFPWPLENATTYTVSPAEDAYFSLSAYYDIYWLCESDYAKLTPATLQASDWAKAEVEKAYDAEIMPFYTLNPYLVDCAQGMTRDEFAATTVMLYAAMTGEAGCLPDVSEEHPFTDVDWETTSYEQEVGMAYNLGFVAGTSETTFSPDATLNREQAAVMLANVYAKLHGAIPAVTATSFADDSAISSWAKSSVAFMAEQGIVSGVGDNSFAPQQTLSIQEAVSMAQRMLENLK